MVTGTGLLIVLLIRQMHGDRADLGFTWEVQPASEGSKAQGRTQACLQGGSGQKRDWRAGQRQSNLQQGSQGGRGLGSAEEGLWTLEGRWRSQVRLHKATKACGYLQGPGIHNVPLAPTFLLKF